MREKVNNGHTDIKSVNNNKDIKKIVKELIKKYKKASSTNG